MTPSIHKSQRGDTIVEVLICLGIIGFVLLASYTLSNRSLIANQRSQERSFAEYIAQTEFEKLRAYTDRGNRIISIPSDRFCFKSSPAGSLQTVTAPSGECNRSLDRYQVTVYKPSTLPGSGAAAEGAPTDGRTFAVVVRWSGVGDSGNEETRQFYRLSTQAVTYNTVPMAPRELGRLYA